MVTITNIYTTTINLGIANLAEEVYDILRTLYAIHLH